MELWTAGTPKTDLVIVCHQNGRRCRAQPRVFEQQAPTNGEGRGETTDIRMDVPGDLLLRCPPPSAPSQCLEINYKVTARREPSYRILTVLSSPLLERKWSIL